MDRLTTVLTTGPDPGKYIGETLESLKMQGITPVIVSDERPAMEKWNEAIRNCETEYLFLPHSDDVYLPEFATEVIACLDAHPEAAACFTLDYIIDEKGRRIGHTGLPFPPQDTYTFPFVFDAMGKYGNFIRCPSVIFRVNHVKGLRYPTECGTANDTAMWFNVLHNSGPICVIPRPLFLYRQHSKSDTQLNVAGTSKQFDHVLAMEYATQLRPDVKTYLAHIAIAKGKKGRADAQESERLQAKVRSGDGCRFLVCHESPGNAGTGILVQQRCIEFNQVSGGEVCYYVYPGEVERRGVEGGCPVIQIPPQQFFRLVQELKPKGIEFHHILRWPLDILDAPSPDKSVWLHDSYLWCAAYHSFNGKEVCNQPEENKCLACTGMPIESFRKKKEYLKRVLPTMKVYANSAYTAMYAGLHLGCRVDVHTFDIPPLGKPFKGKRVGYFGGWYPVKGIDTLMEVALRMPEVQFLLFTNPPDGMLEGRGVYGYENILVMGSYNRMDAPALSNLVDIVVVPSRNESFGLVAREMRQAGVPVVAARVGGLDGSVISGCVGGFVTAIREAL